MVQQEIQVQLLQARFLKIWNNFNFFSVSFQHMRTLFFLKILKQVKGLVDVTALTFTSKQRRSI